MTDTTTTGPQNIEAPKYQEIEYNGKPARLYPDGAIRDSKGWLLTKHPKANQIDATQSREIWQQRKERAREMAIQAIDAGAGLDPAKWGTGEGWFNVVRHTVETYLKSTNLRGMGETLTKLASITGLADEIKPEQRSNESMGIPEVARLVMELSRLTQGDRGDVVDGEVVKPGQIVGKLD